MSVFTAKELEYLAGQRLGRIATVGPDGQPHVVPTSFRYNAEHDAIDVGGLRMSQTKKLRDVQRTGRASIVIDDVLPPWQPRMIEVRGSAAVIPSGGRAFGERFEDTIVRIQPTRIVAFGIDDGESSNARSVPSALRMVVATCTYFGARCHNHTHSRGVPGRASRASTGPIH